MTHAVGTHLGGVRSLEDLRLRCVCRVGCWHLRTARGRRYQRGDGPMRIWSALHGTSLLARRLAWELHTGAPVPSGRSVIDTCEEHDCVNPDHLRAVSRQECVRVMVERGLTATPAKTIANRLQGAKRSRISPEVWGWVYESTQSSAAIAVVLGVPHSHISQKRARRRELVCGRGVA